MQRADRSSELQNWSLQSISQRKGLHNDIRKTRIQWKDEHSSLQTKDGKNASDSSTPAVFR